MRRYSVRVELHEGANYDALHKLMWNAGYRRFWIDDKGVMRKLPTGSYAVLLRETSTWSAKDIRDEVLVIAKTLTVNPQVWVVNFWDWACSLDVIREDPDEPK